VSEENLLDFQTNTVFANHDKKIKCRCRNRCWENFHRPLRHFPQELTDGGSYRARRALFFEEWVATMRLGGNPHLANPPVRRLTFQRPGMGRRRKALFGSIFSSAACAAAFKNPGPDEENGVRPAKPQNPKSSTRPCSRLIQSPAGPCFERWVQHGGCGNPHLGDPPVRRLTISEPAAWRRRKWLSSSIFFSARLRVAQIRARTREWGRPANRQNAHADLRSPTNGRLKRNYAWWQNLTGRGGKPDFPSMAVNRYSCIMKDDHCRSLLEM